MAEKFVIEYKKNSVIVHRQTNNCLLDSSVSFYCSDGRERTYFEDLKTAIQKKGVKRVDDIYTYAREYRVTVLPARPLTSPMLHKRYNTARIGY